MVHWPLCHIIYGTMTSVSHHIWYTADLCVTPYMVWYTDLCHTIYGTTCADLCVTPYIVHWPPYHTIYGILTSVSHHIWYTDLCVGCLLCLAQLAMALITHPHRSEVAEVTQCNLTLWALVTEDTTASSGGWGGIGYSWCHWLPCELMLHTCSGTVCVCVCVCVCVW